MNTPGADRARLRWLCRRGMKELDELLVRFLDERYDTTGPVRQAAFARLLEWPDPDLYALIAGRTAAGDPEIDDVVRQILQRAHD